MKSYKRGRMYLATVLVVFTFLNLGGSPLLKADATSAGKKEFLSSLNVMSYNINAGENASGEYDLQEIAEVIRDSDVDIVGLQKVDKHYSSRSHFDDQVKILAEELGMHYAFGANVDNDPPEGRKERSQYGTAILSKYPIIRSQNHKIGDFSKNEQRGLLEAEIDLGDKRILFYATHLGTDKASRAEEVENILKVTNNKNGPKIIAGLINTAHYSPELERLAPTFFDTLKYEPDVYNSPSTDPHSRDSAIYVSPEWKVNSAGVIESLASTVYPLVSSLELRTAPASANANLSGISLDQEELENFSPDTYYYDVTLPPDTEFVPEVTVIAEDEAASIDLQNATGFPGNTVITVTSEDERVVNQYIVHFKREPVVNGWQTPIKIMSFNIQAGSDAYGNLNLERIASVIEEAQADIVGLQEVDKHWGERSEFIDQAQWLANRLNMEFVYGANLDLDPIPPHDNRRQYGTAVLSKHPITYSKNHLLESFGYEQRGLLETRVDFLGSEISFYNTHFGLTAEQRISQAEETLEIMGRTDGAKIIVGDFNAREDSPELQRFFQEGYVDGFTHHYGEHTFHALFPYATIDFILHSSEFEVTDTAVIHTKASDHRPLVGDYLVASPVESIFFEKDEILLEPNQTYQAKVIGEFRNGFKGTLPDAVYSSSSDAVKVSPEGIITAVHQGEAMITAAYKNERATMKVIVLATDGITIPIMQDTLEHHREDVFSDEAYRSLQIHLTAVGHYDKQQAIDKAVKHMKSFRRLLGHQKKIDCISERLYHILRANADHLIKKWQQSE